MRRLVNRKRSTLVAVAVACLALAFHLRGGEMRRRASLEASDHRRLE
jgi:hypothetical protein